MSKTAKIWSTKSFAFPSGNTAAYLINSFDKGKRALQNIESGWRSSYISNILLIPSVPDGLSSMKPLKEMHVLTWIINMFCWTRQNWPSTVKKAPNITKKFRTWPLWAHLNHSFTSSSLFFVLEHKKVTSSSVRVLPPLKFSEWWLQVFEKELKQYYLHYFHFVESTTTVIYNKPSFWYS